MKVIYKKGITAFLPVLNEELRIKTCLETLRWCDDVILLDKYSLDSTVKIASKFENVRIFYQENTATYNPSEFEVFMNECTTEWCMIVTASGVFHADIAKRIKELIILEEFNFDTIAIPYKPYMLGQCEKYSPWYAEYLNKVVKTSSVTINLNSVHGVFCPAFKSVFKIKSENPQAAYYHLSHETAEAILARHVRYWRGEPNSTVSLNKDVKYILKKTIQLIFLKRTFFKGKNAIALAFSFLSYYMMAYVFKWDKLYGDGEVIYADIKDNILSSWKEN